MCSLGVGGAIWTQPQQSTKYPSPGAAGSDAVAMEQKAVVVAGMLRNILEEICGVEDSEIHFLHVARGQAPGIKFLAMSCVYVMLVCSHLNAVVVFKLTKEAAKNSSAAVQSLLSLQAVPQVSHVMACDWVQWHVGCA